MSPIAKSYLDIVKACDKYVDSRAPQLPRFNAFDGRASFPYDDEHLESLYRLLLPNDRRPHGYLLPETVQKMLWTADFQISHEHPRTVQLLDSSAGKETSASCNAAFASLISLAIEHDLFDVIHGQHSEPFAIIGANYPVQIERFATSLFGTVGRGAHMTVYTRTSAGLKIWVPRRSTHLFTYPGMLDTTVAGGVRANESPFENILHEADEEASLPVDVLRRDVRACGALTYMGTNSGSGAEVGLVVPDIIYLFDLEVGGDVVPKPQDDEVEQFYLWSVEQVKDALLRGEFKTNSAIVMTDFFIRHGIITADNEKDYIEILTRIHRKLPIALAPEAN